MKILIAYYTKTGTTAKCAALLREQFYNHNMTVADLATQTVDLTAYDAVILGAPVRMGHIDQRLRNFLKTHAPLLADKITAYFVCCGDPSQAQETFTRDIPADLLASAVAAAPFGGELSVEAQHGAWNKLLVRLMRRSIKNKQLDDEISDEDKPRFPEIMPDRISRFADEIKRI